MGSKKDQIRLYIENIPRVVVPLGSDKLRVDLLVSGVIPKKSLDGFPPGHPVMVH